MKQAKTPYQQSFERLLSIMNELRNRCPWDKKQTIQTLRPQTIEELYELTDAITHEDWQGIKEELGDLLLHITFYSKLAEEKELFSIRDVIEQVCNKLVFRHPHIYDKVQVENETEVKQNWEKLKKQEGKKSVLSGVPKSLPALVKALRLQEKAKQVGFEWDDTQQVWEKVQEEMKELEAAVHQGKQNEMEDELGDVFFSLINYARFLNIDPENALERTNIKFKTRFELMEILALKKEIDLHEMSLVEMDKLWNEAKLLQK